MATYNGEKYLEAQIQTILEQSYTDFELIIQDDCSNDATLTILKQYENHPRCTIFYNSSNLGYTKNFASVLQKASGDYIALCDQDDLWEKDKLALLMQNIGKNSLIYSNSLLIDEGGKPLGMTLSQQLKNNFISSNEPLNFLFDNSVSAHAALFSKELLPYLKSFPKHIYFDQYIAFVAVAKNGVIYYDKPLVAYRQHATNTLAKKKKQKPSLLQQINNKLEKKYQTNEQMLQKLQEFITLPILSQQDKQLLDTLIEIHHSFPTTFFNFKALQFYLKHKDILFQITTKNKTTLSIKKSIGYKLYKALPIL